MSRAEREQELLAMVNRQQTVINGHLVLRISRTFWSVDGGEPSMLWLTADKVSKASKAKSTQSITV